MWLKLIAVFLLILYHLECQRILNQQKAGLFKRSSFKLRLFIEVATLFLVCIVFLVVLKSTSGFVWGTLGLFTFAAVLMIAISLIRKQNKKTEVVSEDLKEETSFEEKNNSL